MRRYHEEGLREEIREALLITPRTRGQLDGFENNACEAKFSRVSYRAITNDSGDCIANIKADVIRTLACRTFKRSPMPLSHHAFRFSKLVHSMNTANEHISNWLRFCYSEGAQVPTACLLQTLLDEFYKDETGKVSAKSKELIKHLALLACYQRKLAINTEKALLTQIKVAELSGKSIKAWEKTWAKRWSRFHTVLNAFDKEGLDHVYESNCRRKVAKRDANVLVQSVLQIRARDSMASRVGV